MEKETPPKGEIVIYTSADGKISLDAKLENETIWLTQDMMAKLQHYYIWLLKIIVFSMEINV